MPLPLQSNLVLEGHGFWLLSLPGMARSRFVPGTRNEQESVFIQMSEDSKHFVLVVSPLEDVDNHDIGVTVRQGR